MPKKKLLSKSVTKAVESYFDTLEDEQPTNLYQMVLEEVERPLLKVVMEKADNNRSVAAQILGINRGTLRKKLQQYNL